jgi:UDP-glucose 4-epimerase
LRTVLLTGATGFIGRHLVNWLASEGNCVTSLQRSQERVPGIFEILHVPQFSVQHLVSALAGRQYEWVIHLCAYGVRPSDRDVESMFRINVDTTRILVEAASQWPAKAFVFVSSGSEYRMEHVEGPVTEDSPLEMFKPYGASKAAATITALSIARASGLPLAVARVFNVFGPGEAEDRLFPTLAHRLMLAERVPLTAGTQHRDFLFVVDVAEALGALARALESQVLPTQVAVNLSTGNPVRVRDFAFRVAAELGAPTALLGFGDVAMRPDEVDCFSGDPSRLRMYTQWTPRYTIAEGIREGLRQLTGTLR